MNTRRGINTIIYEGYTYRLVDEIPERLLSPIIGTAELYEVPPMHSYRYRTSLQIRNNCLVLTEVTCHLAENDALRLMEEYGQRGSIEYREGFTGFGESAADVFERCALTIKDLAEAIPFTGVIRARQLYVDEVEDGAYQAHDTESCFHFSDGMLQAEDSVINKDPSTFISKFTWSDELEKTVSHRQPSEPDGPLAPETMYYVNPTGNVRQNNTVIASVTWYLRSGWIDHKVLDTMLQDKHPVFRTEMKVKSESNTYLNRMCDLVEEAAKGLELKALRKMAPYIEYSKYSDYPKKLLTAVLVKANNAENLLTASLVQDIVEALEILQHSGLQDPDGCAVMSCAAEFFELVSGQGEAAADLQARACDALCKMTPNEKVRSRIGSMP